MSQSVNAEIPIDELRLHCRPEPIIPTPLHLDDDSDEIVGAGSCRTDRHNINIGLLSSSQLYLSVNNNTRPCTEIFCEPSCQIVREVLLVFGARIDASRPRALVVPKIDHRRKSSLEPILKSREGLDEHGRQFLRRFHVSFVSILKDADD